MKRYIYEIHYLNEDSRAVEYWEADNFKQAKKQIMALYSDDYYKNECPCEISMIAEIKYEVL